MTIMPMTSDSEMRMVGGMVGVTVLCTAMLKTQLASVSASPSSTVCISFFSASETNTPGAPSSIFMLAATSVCVGGN